MSFVPSYVLSNESETAIIYTIPIVYRDNSPQDPFNYVEHISLRGQGSIIVPGSDKASWDLTLNFILQGNDYEDLISKMDTMESTIAKNTRYVLKIGRTSSTTKDYNVKRLTSISWDETSRRIKFIRGKITLRVNSWS